jgi:DNA-binding MarR family transcriptional regulator
MIQRKSLSPTKPRFALPCACANLRRAARIVTKLYDKAFSDTGLELTQFSILMALSRSGEITQGRLGAVLSLDSTTLTRTLKPLIESGFIQSRSGSDRRERLVCLTNAGKKKYVSSLPNWEQAQQELKEKLSPQKYDDLMRLLADLD